MDKNQTVGAVKGFRGADNEAKLVEAKALTLLVLVLGMIAIGTQVIIKL